MSGVEEGGSEFLREDDITGDSLIRELAATSLYPCSPLILLPPLNLSGTT